MPLGLPRAVFGSRERGTREGRDLRADVAAAGVVASVGVVGTTVTATWAAGLGLDAATAWAVGVAALAGVAVRGRATIAPATPLGSGSRTAPR